jgi:hypothetical protein
MNKRAQTALEYLLLLGIVAFIVLAAFSKGGMLTKVHDTAQDQFAGVTNVIMGANPQAIPGGWCEWTPCSQGVTNQFRSCECPAPAFGGAACSGQAQRACP